MPDHLSQPMTRVLTSWLLNWQRPTSHCLALAISWSSTKPPRRRPGCRSRATVGIENGVRTQ